MPVVLAKTNVDIMNNIFSPFFFLLKIEVFVSHNISLL